MMGRQRMYSQVMAKETARLSYLYTMRDAADGSYRTAATLAEIGRSKQNLMSAKAAFSGVLNGIRNGTFPV